MTKKNQLPRHKRLYLILELMNRIHARRRILGKPTAHLHARCRLLSQAWLDARPL